MSGASLNINKIPSRILENQNNLFIHPSTGGVIDQKEWEAFQKTLSDPLYLKTAESIGIKSYSSLNDYRQVLAALSGKKSNTSTSSNSSSSSKKDSEGNDNNGYDNPADAKGANANDGFSPMGIGGNPSLMIDPKTRIPGVDVRLMGEQIGIRSSDYKRQRSRVGKGMSQFAIKRTSPNSSSPTVASGGLVPRSRQTLMIK